ncbi:hypothetical protein McpSp1_14720 [Methanocorpusculaceae archaeon Sp1]|nr:hypothetical protein [Methanocorpusculaceae archaeon Sp1]
MTELINYVRKTLYAVLTDKEYCTFGELIHRMGFANKTAYLTSVIQHSLYGYHVRFSIPAGELDPDAGAWIQYRKRMMQDEDRLRQNYFDVLTDLAFPVIATRGGQRAFHLLEQEITDAVADRAGIVPTGDQMRYWMQVYETIFAEQLAEYRTNLNYEARIAEERERMQESMSAEVVDE